MTGAMYPCLQMVQWHVVSLRQFRLMTLGWPVWSNSSIAEIRERLVQVSLPCDDETHAWDSIRHTTVNRQVDSIKPFSLIEMLIKHYLFCLMKCHLAQYNILVAVVCWSVVSVYSVVSAYYESLQHVALWNQTIFISTWHFTWPQPECILAKWEWSPDNHFGIFFSLSSIVTLLDFTEQIGCIPLKHYPIYGVPGWIVRPWKAKWFGKAWSCSNPWLFKTFPSCLKRSYLRANPRQMETDALPKTTTSNCASCQLTINDRSITCCPWPWPVYNEPMSEPMSEALTLWHNVSRKNVLQSLWIPSSKLEFKTAVGRPSGLPPWFLSPSVSHLSLIFFILTSRVRLFSGCSRWALELT